MLNHLYPLARSYLFRMDAEQAHHRALTSLRWLERTGAARALVHPMVNAPRTVMGLTFRNPVGLAAGLDKDGSCIDGLAALGFGFIEVGTVTPRPQPGNPRPRLFRIPEANALINRMGFNNAGIERYIANIEQSRYSGVLGFNLGKNADTPLERAADDYLYCLEQVYLLSARISYRVEGYVTINISSPNTKNLRQLQSPEQLDALLNALNQKQSQLADQHGKKMPLVLKIAPDLDGEQIKTIAAAVLRYRIDGVIATNTSLSRSAIAGLRYADEPGGLSGQPVLAASTSVIRKLHAELGHEVPIIGVGGIFSAADAQEKIAAGASLIQLYTGLIYHGPKLVGECVRALSVQPVYRCPVTMQN